MNRTVLFTASTYSHLHHFHLPYLRAFQDRGWTVHAACANAPETIPGAERSISVPFEKRMFSPQNLKAALALRRLIRREGYALVVTHTSLAAFFTRLALLGLSGRPKVVNMVHGYLFDDRSRPLKRALLLGAERLTAPVTDLLLTMNRWDYETAQRLKLGRQVGWVPGIGVDFSRLDAPKVPVSRREAGLSEDAFVLIYGAEFSPRKSQAVLIRALAELPERAALVLPGQGALLEECRALARSLGVADRVIFPGYAADMAPWYALADAAVSSSRSEGLPFNIMEAMYLGLPVAASAVKGHTDLIDPGSSGLLYPYGSSAACADAIRLLMEDEALCRSLAERARAAVPSYALAEVLPVVMDWYESVCPDPAARRERRPARI